MKNLMITAILSLGLLVPGVSFAGTNVFGVDADSIAGKEKVKSNLVKPSHISDNFYNTLTPQKLQGDLPVYGANNFENAYYIFGVKLNSKSTG